MPDLPEIEWYYPENLGDIPDLLQREKVILHGGGTGILRGGLKNTVGLIDLGRLRLNTVERQDGKFRLGAGCSYAEAVHGLNAHEQNHVLMKSLSQAASTPLRNRITLGGSIALFPYWSDLMGPLLALEAEVNLIGQTDGTFALVEYVQKRELRQNTLIVSVQWEDRAWDSAYHRQTRTRSDRPMFSVTVLSRTRGAQIEDLRIFVVGCSGRYHRCSDVESLLIENKADRAAVSRAVQTAEIGFPARMGFSADYLEHCGRTAVERCLNSVLGV